MDYQRRQGMIFITLVCTLGLGVPSLFAFQDAHAKLTWQEQLDTHGVTTVGQVTQTSTSGGSKSTTYYVGYSFEVNGRTYRHKSPVAYSDYQRAVPGQPIQVIYPSNNPDISRAVISIGRKNAEGERTAAYILLGLALFLPLIVYGVLKRQEKKQG